MTPSRPPTEIGCCRFRSFMIGPSRKHPTWAGRPPPCRAGRSHMRDSPMFSLPGGEGGSSRSEEPGGAFSLKSAAFSPPGSARRTRVFPSSASYYWSKSETSDLDRASPPSPPGREKTRRTSYAIALLPARRTIDEHQAGAERNTHGRKFTSALSFSFRMP